MTCPKCKKSDKVNKVASIFVCDECNFAFTEEDSKLGRTE